jgi:hypothetical protein
MTMIAYAFLQSRRLKAAGRKKKNPRTASATNHASRQASDTRHLRTVAATPMSALPHQIPTAVSMKLPK